ncbi:hypothetical protein AYO49_00970 [Verrucomicrobiaceae bacterium SCGC AG-212-N21]|nr:hypothetical protein AYO49_00970 [Verrucomicrobiaceae bacterium SCGC AG-212-N21]
MKRVVVEPRVNWRALVEADGLSWHQDGGGKCWNEGTAYLFAPDEIERVRCVSRELHALMMSATSLIISKSWWSRIGIAEKDVSAVIASWEQREPNMHGRFDFLLDEHGDPRLLEYNAETALLLVETAAVQRTWSRHVAPGLEQWNSLHESLVASWQRSRANHVHLAWRPRHREVEATVRYMAGIIREAEVQATMMAMHSMGYHRGDETFVDQAGAAVECCYKLYPWEWMIDEPFSRHLVHSRTRFVEPLWCLIPASKGMLAILWELYPDHPALVPCYDHREKLGGAFVSKPLFGHEGQNVEIHSDGAVTAARAGDYGNERRVYQSLVRSPRYDGRLAQLGVWVVEGEPVALGMRESIEPIICGDSSFVPHAVTHP